MRARCFHARVWKKSGPARGRARTRGRRYFFTRNERVQGETCIRLAGGREGGRGGEAGGEMREEAGKAGRVAAVEQGTRMRATRGEGGGERARGGDGRGWRGGGPPFAVDFSGLFFTGDGPRLPG